MGKARLAKAGHSSDIASYVAMLFLTKWYNVYVMFKKQVKCSECGYLGIMGGLDKIGEIDPQARLDLLRHYEGAPLFITCLRGQDHMIAGVPEPGEPISQENLINNSYLLRKCVYYYSYNPGYTPEQHLELQREAKTRRLFIIGMILAAVIGALVGAIISSLIS